MPQGSKLFYANAATVTALVVLAVCSHDGGQLKASSSNPCPIVICSPVVATEITPSLMGQRPRPLHLVAPIASKGSVPALADPALRQETADETPLPALDAHEAPPGPMAIHEAAAIHEAEAIPQSTDAVHEVDERPQVAIASDDTDEVSPSTIDGEEPDPVALTFDEGKDMDAAIESLPEVETIAAAPKDPRLAALRAPIPLAPCIGTPPCLPIADLQKEEPDEARPVEASEDRVEDGTLLAAMSPSPQATEESQSMASEAVIEAHRSAQVPNLLDMRKELSVAIASAERAVAGEKWNRVIELVLEALGPWSDRSAPIGTKAPELARAYFLLGKAYRKKKEYAAAAEFFKRGVRENPDDASMQNTLAWTLAIRPDRTVTDLLEATQASEHAVKLSHGKVANYLDTLAKIYFLNGDARQALETQKKVVARVPKRDSFRRRLRQYERAVNRLERLATH